MFSIFAKGMSRYLGSPYAFTSAILLVILWLCVGPFFGFSLSWQIVLDTTATTVTFLMVFLLQNTQNRDTIALHLKLDEIIRSNKNARNELMKVEQLSDSELEEMLKRYEDLAGNIKQRIKSGESVKGTPNIKINPGDENE